jgi:PD-(D/E)XK nuclease superfamily
MQPSASKTSILLNCQYAFSDDLDLGDVEVEEREAPRYGSAFHELMEGAPLEVGSKFPASFPADVDRVGVAWDLTPTVREELAGHVRGSLPVLQKWLAGKNPWEYVFPVSVLERETSYAIAFKNDGKFVKVRRITNPTREGHVYEELAAGEIAMTVDLMLDASMSLVMDYKTGLDENFARPSKHAQLRTLGLIPKVEPVVAIFHADRRGLPVIYAEELSAKSRRIHARDLARALRGIGLGYMRPGDWCKYCPARSVCPTQTAELLAGAAALVEGGTAALALASKSTAMTTAAELGKLHLFFAELDRIEKRARPLIKSRTKELLDSGEIVKRPDGKVLLLRTRSEERLSKGRIVEALGAKEAERLFDKLRKAGALEAAESEGLYAVFPD